MLELKVKDQVSRFQNSVMNKHQAMRSNTKLNSEKDVN